MADTAPLRQEAQAAVQSGDRDGARAALETLVRENPRDEEAWLWLAGLTDPQDQALAYLSRALVLNPANERARAGVAWIGQARARAQADAQTRLQGSLARGQRYLDSGEIDAAVWEFEAAVQQFPDSAKLYANLAVAYYQQNRWPEASRKLEMAVRLQPDYVDAYYSLGVIREAMGDQEHAAEAWVQVLLLEPGHAQARRRLIAVGAALPQTEAEAQAPTFFMVCPHCQGEIAEQTTTCPHCGHTLFNVCPNCQTLVSTDQRFCPTCHHTISSAGQRRETVEAEPGLSSPTDLRRIEAEARPVKAEAEAKPRRKRWRFRTVALFLPTAAFWLVALLAGAIGLAFGFNPTWFPASLYSLGREIQAFAAPLPALLLPHPMDRLAPAAMIPIGLLMLGGTVWRAKWVFYANLILPGALLLISLVDMFTGQHMAVALVRAILAAGVVVLTLLAASEYEESELTQRIAASPRDAELYYNRGLVFYNRGQLDEAIAEWQQALSLQPNHLPSRNLLGLAWAEKGRFKDALQQLEIARRTDPRDVTTLNTLRDVQKTMQQKGISM